ncbi:hypothetical protein DL768_001554 [Monosporascus sp. mg162]|nr:hypothetical protein DL768_001554 [Monosporascus sp. mg162]
MRFVGRMLIKGEHRFWWDDWAALASVPTIFFLNGICLAMMEYGLGRHITTIPPEEMDTFLKIFFMSYFAYDLALSATKLAAAMAHVGSKESLCQLLWIRWLKLPHWPTPNLSPREAAEGARSHGAAGETPPPKLLVLSSADGAGIDRIAKALQDSYRVELGDAGEFLAALGCPWSPLGSTFDHLLWLGTRREKLQRREYPQISDDNPYSFESNTIADRYAAGHLSQEPACKVAYFRGICSAELAEPEAFNWPPSARGCMMSVGLSESEASSKITRLNDNAKSYGITMACINSPRNVTVSGEESLIDALKAQLDDEKVFARKLRVLLAYHSEQMQAILEKLGNQNLVPMLSSVTGKAVPGDSLVDPAYWVRNMVSPVRFSHAVTAMCATSPAQIANKIDMSHLLLPVVDHLLEIGPHVALHGPRRDILEAGPKRTSRPAIT